MRDLATLDYKIEGYEYETANLEDKGSTRGGAMYIRKPLKFSKLDVGKVACTVSASISKEIISIDINLSKNEKMIIINIYRSPNSDAKENLNINEFFKGAVNLKYFYQIILGDFNRKDIDWMTVSSPLEDGSIFIEATRDGYLTQHILSPTRCRGTNGPSTLDLLFTAKEQNIESVEIDAPLGKSDHSVIKILYRCELEDNANKYFCDYAKGDYQKMRQLLNINWENLFEGCNGDINQMWEIFVNKYKYAEEECIPQNILKTGKRIFTYLDRISLSKRNKKYRLWKRYLATQDVNVYQEYCKCRNHVRRLTRNAVKKYEGKIAKRSKTNNKAFCKFVNSKIKLRSKIPSLYPTNKPDSIMVTDENEKAGIFGRFFSSVFVKEPEWTRILDYEEKPRISKELELTITKKIITKTLHDLIINKSPGPDNLHPKIFKELSQEIVEPLFIIFNLSI